MTQQALFFLPFLVLLASAQDQPIQIRVDARDVTRHIIHVSMTMPARPGPMTLAYPEWIPGEHSPTGPITDLIGLRITAGGQTIPWKRDGTDMYAFHIEAPAGTTELDVVFDFISPPETPGFSSGSSATSELAVLNWNQLLLYPKGVPSDKLTYQASVRVPHGWRYGTALPIASESGDRIEFRPASLTTFIDSPLLAGTHFRTIDLGEDRGEAHYLHVAADSDAATMMTPETEKGYRNLVAETGALFGSRHYRSYHFLLTLSDHVAHFGLEHHESSDDRLGERALIDESGRRLHASLLTHEFTHSWNGKYRRPAGLATEDYSKPMQGELLWVYEGLTNYLGEILAPRSGLQSAEDYREALADEAAALDRESGRRWRPLEDTAVAAQLLYAARDDYAEYRRSVDYYPEGSLIWLEADVTIRNLSGGKKSLNDFCQAFHGGPGGAPELKPYTFDDVVASLNDVQPYEWAAFLKKRVESTEAHAPLGGIEGSGWKLVYTPKPSAIWKFREQERRLADLSYSIGLTVKDDGSVIDVAYGGPAQRAGVAPAMKIVAVNSRQFNLTGLREAVAATAQQAQSVDLLTRDGEYYRTIRVEYRGGEQYPHLEPNGKPDLLSKILAPLAK